ncbi:MAG: MlaD family protein, partial [Pseudomonadota bacterium]
EILVDAFIEAPHDARLTTASRFWDASGFSVSLGAGGISLDVDSLSSLVSGGLAFETLYEGGGSVAAGQVFEIYPDEATARRIAVARVIADPVMVAVFFDDTIDGLSPGAPVRYGGLGVGEVAALAVDITDAQDGRAARLRATLALDPGLLGMPDGAGEEEVYDFLADAVAGGLRARLATESLLSRALVVDLASLPDAAPAAFDRDADPHAILPSVASDLTNFTATAEGVLERINALPIEALLDQATRTLASFEALAADEALRDTPRAALSLIDETRALVADDDLLALPGDLRRAVADLAGLSSALVEGEAAARLSSALAAADQAAASLADAAEDAPSLVADLRTLAAKANGLPAEELIRSATRFVSSAERLIASEGMRDLPPALGAALDEMRTALETLNDGGVVENANATLASARDAATAVANATEILPDLALRLEGMVGQAEELVGAYDGRSTFNAETLEALREIQDAARAVSRLARAIERDPNSIILGR